jgi:hypothetical protein
MKTLRQRWLSIVVICLAIGGGEVASEKCLSAAKFVR